MYEKETAVISISQVESFFLGGGIPFKRLPGSIWDKKSW